MKMLALSTVLMKTIIVFNNVIFICKEEVFEVDCGRV